MSAPTMQTVMDLIDSRTDELVGAADQLHGAVVGIHVRQLHVGIVGGDLGRDGPPQGARLHDIGLVHRADAALAGAGQFKGRAADAGDLGLGIGLGVIGAALAVGADFIGAGQAEIDARRGLAHDQDVEAPDQVGLQRRGVQQFVETDGGPQVGVEVQRLT